MNWGVEGRGRRERAVIDDMSGCARHWASTSLPMKPVQPVRMIFMVGAVRW